jgi:hypothetical protein
MFKAGKFTSPITLAILDGCRIMCLRIGIRGGGLFFTDIFVKEDVAANGLGGSNKFNILFKLSI